MEGLEAGSPSACALQAPHPPLRGGGGSAAGGSRNPAEPPPPPPPLGGRSSRSMPWCSGPVPGSLLRHDPSPRRRRRLLPGGGGCQGPAGSRPPRSLGPEPPGSAPLRAAPPQHWPAPSPDVTRRCHARTRGARREVESAERGRPRWTPPTEGLRGRTSDPQK